MRAERKIIEIDETLCDGCGACVPSCEEGALEIIDGKAKMVSEIYCDGLGACLGECPKGALRIVEREADEFDEEAVRAHLRSKSKEEKAKEATIPCGCLSTSIQTFRQTSPCGEANKPAFHPSSDSALSHWPVQIRLVPPAAPFLKGADLLVAADCTPFAYPNFHKDFLYGKTVLVGCPKLDDAQDYIHKFSGIFSTSDINTISVIVMEVPCCQGLPVIVESGMEKAGKKIPMEKVVISVKGDLIGKEQIAA